MGTDWLMIHRLEAKKYLDRAVDELDQASKNRTAVKESLIHIREAAANTHVKVIFRVPGVNELVARPDPCSIPDLQRPSGFVFPLHVWRVGEDAEFTHSGARARLVGATECGLAW